MQVTFPHRAMWRSVTFSLTGQSMEPQQSISGAETVVPVPRGRWTASMSFVIKGEAQVLQWQAFLAQMEGRVGTTLVPVRSRFRPVDRDGHALSFCTTADLADAQTWDHFGFQNSTPTFVIAAGPVALRATQMDVTLMNSTGLRPGQFFSIGERLYRVQAYWQPAAGVHRIMFQPPLRQAVFLGQRLEIARPVCRMRFASEEEGLYDQSLDVMPVVNVNFVEAI